ncbi:MAG TPA: flagellar hook protein FlgE [Smithellaceae bacterium]|nr:flagellar hook protein FlgE [Smithellaceae bacterium]
MGSALWAGISGLNASAKQLDVVANNLANVNTLGFKGDMTFFADVLSSSISGGSSGTLQVGRGVAVAEVQTSFASGSFETTGNATDAAIDGDGFFMVNDNEGATYYTRAGAFHLNANGVLVDINGYYLQGQMFREDGSLSALGNITLTGLQSEPQMTTTYSLGANLNSQAAVNDTYTTTQSIYDSLGAVHTFETVFTKTANNTWTATFLLDGTAVTSPASVLFEFDSGGAMTAPTDDVEITMPALGTGATFGTVTWDLTSPQALAITQYASASVIRATTADGYTSGNLKSLAIDPAGIISGFFTNGQTSELAQIILASFPNPWALNKLGSNLFGETVMSGSSVRNIPGASGMGTLTPNTLEMSNTDIATEFIRMITAQKAYQANAKVITTEDTLMQVLMNIKQ